MKCKKYINALKNNIHTNDCTIYIVKKIKKELVCEGFVSI